MEDLKDLLFDLTGEFRIAHDSKGIEEMSFGYIKPISKFNNLEDCIKQDEESDKETEKTVAINSNKNDN